ncbi:hypothetical protein RsTz2092_12730 [Deferribacterales bacterium RsTz2092]
MRVAETMTMDEKIGMALRSVRLKKAGKEE